MRLKSAFEDLEVNTLGAVPGSLGRFAYLGELHDGNGNYGHWGLVKVYGGEDAQGAMRASHRSILSEVLKRPLAVLLDELATCSQAYATEKEFLKRLAQSPPKPLSPAARAHLGSVLSALSALVESQNSANPQAE